MEQQPPLLWEPGISNFFTNDKDTVPRTILKFVCGCVWVLVEETGVAGFVHSAVKAPCDGRQNSQSWVVYS